MSALFRSESAAGAVPADSIESCPADVSGSPLLSPVVGHGLPLSDAAREAAIHKAGDLFLRYWAKWEATGDFQYRGDADRALRLQSLLIQGRSPEQVARMEKERGLR
jgi:hypothetical protein